MTEGQECNTSFVDFSSLGYPYLPCMPPLFTTLPLQGKVVALCVVFSKSIRHVSFSNLNIVCECYTTYRSNTDIIINVGMAL